MPKPPEKPTTPTPTDDDEQTQEPPEEPSEPNNDDQYIYPTPSLYTVDGQPMYQTEDFPSIVVPTIEDMNQVPDLIRGTKEVYVVKLEEQWRVIRDSPKLHQKLEGLVNAVQKCNEEKQGKSAAPEAPTEVAAPSTSAPTLPLTQEGIQQLLDDDTFGQPDESAATTPVVDGERVVSIPLDIEDDAMTDSQGSQSSVKTIDNIRTSIRIAAPPLDLNEASQSPSFVANLQKQVNLVTAPREVKTVNRKPRIHMVTSDEGIQQLQERHDKKEAEEAAKKKREEEKIRNERKKAIEEMQAVREAVLKECPPFDNEAHISYQERIEKQVVQYIETDPTFVRDAVSAFKWRKFEKEEAKKAYLERRTGKQGGRGQAKSTGKKHEEAPSTSTVLVPEKPIEELEAAPSTSTVVVPEKQMEVMEAVPSTSTAAVHEEMMGIVQQYLPEDPKTPPQRIRPRLKMTPTIPEKRLMERQKKESDAGSQPEKVLFFPYFTLPVTSGHFRSLPVTPCYFPKNFQQIS